MRAKRFIFSENMADSNRLSFEYGAFVDMLFKLDLKDNKLINYYGNNSDIYRIISYTESEDSTAIIYDFLTVRDDGEKCNVKMFFWKAVTKYQIFMRIISKRSVWLYNLNDD